MDYMSDAAIDNLIREDEQKLRRFSLFFQNEEERRRHYGADSFPKQVVATPAPPRRPGLSGIPSELLSEDDEEILLYQYQQKHRHQNSNNAVEAKRSGPPPPFYDGPLLTLTTDGPFTRAEILAYRQPLRGSVRGESTEKRRSRHYPRPKADKSKETDRSSLPGESLRRWKYKMGLVDE